MSPGPLVSVEASGLVSTASAAWRLRGNIRATVVVKAEFAFADGNLTQVQAQPVRPDTELAFVLTHAEVLFAGLRQAKPVTEPARMALWRGSQELLGVDFDEASDAGLGGRLSPFAPERAAHLHGFSPTALHQPFVELPDTFDGAFFQSAPPTQRLAGLAGGDIVVLDNLFPGHRRLSLQLPTVEVAGRGRMGERVAPIRLGLDTVCIDAQTHRCTLLWRGRIAASTVEALKQASAIVEHKIQDAGRVQGDMPAPWPKAGASVVAVPALAAVSPFEGTMDLGATAIRAAATSSPTPFAEGPTRSGPSEPRAEIPGAPWSASPGAVVPPAAGILETMGLGDLSDYGASPPPGGLVLPKGIRRPKVVMAAEPEPVPESVNLEQAAVVASVDLEEAKTRAAADEQRKLEETEAERLEAERKARELADAEERRRAEAERFAAEQRAEEKAAAEREAQQAAELKKSRKKIKTGMYGNWKLKNK